MTEIEQMHAITSIRDAIESVENKVAKLWRQIGGREDYDYGGMPISFARLRESRLFLDMHIQHVEKTHVE